MKVLITGAAGFIGSYLAKRLLDEKAAVTGIDNLNDYYDVDLKMARLEMLSDYEGFEFCRADISDADRMKEIFEQTCPDVVVNLAAQAGVRYSITNPDEYIQSNVIGFYNILHADTLTTTERKACPILFLRQVHPYMEPTLKCPIVQRIRWIIRYPYTRQPKNQMSLWRMHTANCMGSRVRGFAFLRYMVRWEDRIWHILVLQIKW